MDMQFYLDNFYNALAEQDYDTALEWKDGIMRLLAWQKDPKTVATMDEALKAYEKKYL